MRASNKQLTILSEAEQAALYELPDFDDEQRLDYLNLTGEEQALMRKRSSLSAQVYCALQIGYFKAKQLFFPITRDEVAEDLTFILEQYFPAQIFHPDPITKHQHYAQCHAIAAHFNYKLWSKDFELLLFDQSQQILRRDVSPQFIVLELLGFLREKKIMRPGYTILQAIVSQALNTERKRLAALINASLTESDRTALRQLLLEEETLSGLAELKHDPKDFKVRMMDAEREKLITIKPLYHLAKSLLPKLQLSQQNIQYYASLVHYYTIHKLRKKIKSEQADLYLLCYLSQRYLQLCNNLVDDLYCDLKKFEDESKEKAKEAFAQYAVNQAKEAPIMRRLAHLFIKEALSDDMRFGEVRQEVFTTIISKEELQKKMPNPDAKPLKALDFKWKMIDKHFHRYKLHCRPLIMSLDFSSTVADSPWLTAITWLKKVWSLDKPLNHYPIDHIPAGTIPKRLHEYLLYTDSKGDPKLHAERYEFWIYRQLKKRLKAGELYLEDSIHHRSLKQELTAAYDKGALLQPLSIPGLNKPIQQLLDEHFAELHAEWNSFNNNLMQGKLKHLRYDAETKTLHLKKSKDDKDDVLQHRFYEQLPLCDIADVLRFVKEQCRYSTAFTHIQPRYAKIPADENSLNASIISQALNNGNLNMAEISDIPYDRLLDTYQSRIRLQTLKKANDLIGDDIAKCRFSHFTH